LVLGTAIVAFALLLGPVVGQTQQTDLQQMQQFNSLTPEQQQAILQRLGQGGPGTMGGTGSPSGGYNSSQAALIQQQLLQLQRRQLQGQEEQQEPPVFKANDTVLIDIALPGEQLPNLANPQIPAMQSGVQSDNSNVTALSSAGFAQLNANAQRFQEQLQRQFEALTQEEQHRLEDLVTLIRSKNPYQLDNNGTLLLPGIPSLDLSGLTAELATRRVAAEPALAKLQIQLTLLPLKKSGEAGLKPFGYDLFNNSALSAVPQLNVPVPADYIVGPGDVLEIQLFGSQNQSLQLTVARDGRISFPQLGPVDVGGLRYSVVKSDIEARVARQIIGTRADVSMGETRTISVFVLGEAKYPGSYTVTGLATVTTALFAAGGVKPNGSLRTIQVKRQGEVVRTLDLYDLLLRGDSGNDIKLLPGDVVFIPSVGHTVSVDGEVQRPAIYELKGSASVADLIQMGGGLTPRADRNNAALVRVDEFQRRIVLNVDPSAATAAGLELRNGDQLDIARLRPQLDSGITLRGYVYRPKYFAWREGLRLTDVVSSIDELKPDADQNYLLIRRELPPNRRLVALSADLGAALRAPGSAADIILMPRDTITVFDLETSREAVIQPLMDELRVQANLSRPTEIVHVDGRVKVPGDYPLEQGMRVSDLIRAGGSLDSAAYGGRAELSRYTVENGEQRQTEVLSIDLAAIRSGDQSANLILQSFDRLSIKQMSGWSEEEQVVLRGEVRFPGIYTIKRGETLRSVIERAGGLTDLAFPDGSVFTRVELRVREQEQLDRLAERLRVSIAEVAMMGARANQTGTAQTINIGETLLTELRAAKAIGRLVINLNAAINAKPGSSNDIILRNGDELAVPKERQEVMVLGEVQDASSHLYQRRLSRDDYIDQSGGLTRQADRSQIYVVRADGSVEAGRRGWFSARDSVDIRPGDAIVVPLNTERLPALSLWEAVTSIVYNLAIGAAAVHALY
jgi:protein involved in polysaccharide export with SLBB domain